MYSEYSEIKLPSSSFWNAASTRQLIAAHAVGNWELPKDVDPWRSMLRVMETSNNEDSGVLCPYCLWMFVDLFQLYGARLKRKWGSEWPDLPAKELQDDHLSLVFLNLLCEILAIDRIRAHRALSEVAEKGLRYIKPGGRPATYRSFDFGIEFLIKLTAKIDAVLGKQREQKNQVSSVATVQGQNSRPRVLMDWAGRSRVSLHFSQKKIILTPTRSKLISCLVLAKEPVLFEHLWKHMYPKVEYKADRSGPPSLLRTHKKEIVKQMQSAWGSPRSGHTWIESMKGTGYLLNRSVTWQLAKDFKQNLPEHFLPPREIDYRQQRDDE